MAQNIFTKAMVKKLSILLTLAIFFAGCETSDIDPDYPTTYKRLPSTTLEQLRNEYAQNNVYLNSSLNNFGFCSRFGKVGWGTLPPPLDTLTEIEAIEVIRAFISHNPSTTGVSNPDDIQIVSIISNVGDADGLIHWTARPLAQMVDTIEVLDTEFLFRIIGGALVSCQNNWFPEVYIPKEFQVNLEEAKSLLVGWVVSHVSTAGIESKVRILTEHMEESKSGLKVLPMWSEDKIELRVVWELWIQGPVHYLIYVDVMNGEILREEPTIP